MLELRSHMPVSKKSLLSYHILIDLRELDHAQGLSSRSPELESWSSGQVRGDAVNGILSVKCH